MVLATAESMSESCVTTCVGALAECHKKCNGDASKLMACSVDNNGCNANCTKEIFDTLTKSTAELNNKTAAGAAALHKCTTDWTSCGTDCLKDSQKLGAKLSAKVNLTEASQQLMDCNEKCMKTHRGCLGAL